MNALKKFTLFSLFLMCYNIQADQIEFTNTTSKNVLLKVRFKKWGNKTSSDASITIPPKGTFKNFDTTECYIEQILIVDKF